MGSQIWLVEENEDEVRPSTAPTSGAPTVA